MAIKNPHFTTKHANSTTVEHHWYLADASQQTLGRFSAKIASILKGKNKVCYTPHVDCGDFVIITNAEKINLKGKKWTNKNYIRFSGYPGGKKEISAKDLLAHKPTAILETAIKGMLPKNSLGRQMFRKLFVYTGSAHPHIAQKPQELKF